MRKDRSEPIQRRRQGPVIERAGQSTGQGLRAGQIFSVLAAAAVLLMVFADGKILQDLFSTFEHRSPARTEQKPAPPRVEPPRAEAPRPPVSQPTVPQAPRSEAPRPEVPKSDTARPAPPISAPAAPPVASAPPVAPVTPPAATPSTAPARVSLLVPRPPGARPAIAPFSDGDVTQVVTKQIRRFNESRDVAEKQEASQQIHAAALIGHPLARSIIVSAYRTSTIVQNASSPADVVRMALDFAAKGQSDSAAARGFAALGEHLTERDEAGFARAVIDAMRDDARLREPQAARTVLAAISGNMKACAALAAAAGSVPSVGCDGVLANALAAQAVARGPAGQEEAAYRNAERAFARYLQEAL